MKPVILNLKICTAPLTNKAIETVYRRIWKITSEIRVLWSCSLELWIWGSGFSGVIVTTWPVSFGIRLPLAERRGLDNRNPLHLVVTVKSKGKGKVHPRTGHEGPDGSTLSLTWALYGGGWSAPRPGRFTSGKDLVPIVQEAGWAPEPVWTGAETLASTGIRSPDCLARSESLYRLRYPGRLVFIIEMKSAYCAVGPGFFFFKES